MTYLSLALGIGLSLVGGYFLTGIILNQVHLRSWVKSWLGIGVGLGVSSLLFFTMRLFTRPEAPLYILIELVLISGLGLIWLWLRRRAQQVDILSTPSGQSSLPAAWTGLLTLSLVIAALVAALVFIFGTLIFPNGGWDAWAIWNIAARFLFLGRTEWTNMFDPSIFHSDYPLLLGSSVARLWTYRGVVDLIAPAAVGFIFSLATFGLLLGLANLTRGRVASLLSGLALLGSSTILVVAPTQCADIPLGYYLLGALGCLSLYSRNAKSGFLLLSGVLLGLGAWTKNEGWLLAIAVLVGWILVELLFGRGVHTLRDQLRNTGWLLAGFVPLIFFPLYQKWFLAPPNDLIAGQGGQTLARMLDPDRWLLISRSFWNMLYSLDPKYSAPLGLLVLLVLIFGVRRRVFGQPAVWINLVTLLVALAGYFLVYLTTPHGLQGHLSTSLFRLYAQLWPAAVFTMILLIKLPGETDDSQLLGEVGTMV